MKWLLISLALLLPFVVNAATEIRTVSAEATGVNREDAIYNALSEAIRQVRGAQISASRQVKSALLRVTERSEGGSERSTTMSASQTSNTQVSSSGLISGYRILSVSDAPGGGGKLARLKVDIPVYKTPGSSSQDNRWRMAVYPVWPPRPLYQVGGLTLSRLEVSSRLTQSINDALVQSRRFAMLARDRDEEIMAERIRMAGDDIPVSEKAMLGNDLGAEYLVSARVVEFTFDAKQKVSSLTGERSVEQTGALVLDVRVLVPATGAIVWSETLNLSPDQLRLNFDGSKGAIQTLFARAGQEVALSVIDVVWPPLVEAREGDELIINMGGGLMQAGDQWDVYSLGAVVRNSHSGNSLGRSESLAGTIEITRANPKLAYAKVVDGNVEGVGHVLRRRAQSSRKQSAAEAVRGTRKRTCLPIDPC